MAISPMLVKKRLQDLSVEELEARYEALKSNFHFDTKEAQIKHIIDYYLKASHSTNTLSTRKAIEELLKEKTGKEYRIENKYFELTSTDVVEYISNNTNLIPNQTILVDFFSNLTNVNDKEKLVFLISLIQNTDNFSNFINEIQNCENSNNTFEKHSKIANEYYFKNKVIS